jgi:hypothetical protein
MEPARECVVAARQMGFSTKERDFFDQFEHEIIETNEEGHV